MFKCRVERKDQPRAFLLDTPESEPTLAVWRIGCSGWSYPDWVGPFYPENAPPKEFLRLYSSVFDCVEIDSTYYRTPYPSTVTAWRRSTPERFMFAAKFPKKVTHDMKLEGVEEYISRFYRVIGELKGKLGPLLVQLPPSFKYESGRRSLEHFLGVLPKGFRHAVEFRHRSWFRPELQSLLRDHGVALCWSVTQYLSTPEDVTADFLYMRFVGDRSISSFEKIQRDRSELMGRWYRAMDNLGDRVKERWVFFNNHFAGFGPGSVNEFRRLAGLLELDWSSLAGRAYPQRTLRDF